jgi:hypothetical protein
MPIHCNLVELTANSHDQVYTEQVWVYRAGANFESGFEMF